jgi:ABC-type phosphate transport system substrate-binding protein
MVIPFAKSSGSSLGFKNFLAGGTDIATASRALKQSDYDSADCEQTLGQGLGVIDGVAQYECQGRFPFGVLVGRDMLAIIVNKQLGEDVPAILDMSNVQLQAAINTQSFQGQALNLYVPDALSGTRDFFEDQLEVDLAGVPGFVDDVDITDGVSEDPQGLGVAPLAFVLGASGLDLTYTVVAINGDNPQSPFVNPDDYFFTRPLFKYFDKAHPNEEAIDFICELLEDEGATGVVEAVGYKALSAEEIAEITAQPELLCGLRVNPKKQSFNGVFREMSFCQDANILSIIGSSTVFPISLAAARIFPSTMAVFVPASTGSSIGLSDTIASATNIGAASRAIKQSDYDAFECSGTITDGKTNEPCQGVLPLGIQVGTDMLAVIINTDHAAVAAPNFSFTMQDLLDLFVNGASWSSIVPFTTCVGPPVLFVPDKNSGTHDFMEEALEDAGVCDGAACDITTPGFVNDGDIKDGVAANVCGLGFLGRAFVEDVSTTVAINGIKPSDDNPAYELARPLFYYFDNTPDAYDAIVNEYICYVTSSVGQDAVAAVGYTKNVSPPPSSDIYCAFPNTVFADP